MKPRAESTSVHRGLFYEIAHMFAALKYSVNGFKMCFRDEMAFRQECVLAIPHFLMVIVLPMDLWLRLYLGFLWFLLVVVELLNTAIEAVVDLASPERHELAQKAKDCASAAVMGVIVVFILSWFFVLGRFLVVLF